jgi:GH35 family endo-1,4-beta-xylanase
MQNTLQLYRNNQPHLVINIDENTVFSQVVMGEHIITSSFISEVSLDINEGDYTEFRGERFTINRPLPPLDKEGATHFKYDLTFEGYIYDLHDAVLRHMGSLEFSYFGTPASYIQIIVDCMNSVSGGWTVGTIDLSEEQAISFFESGKGFSCKEALVKVATTFGLEFWLTGKTINLTAKAGVDTSLTFEQGRGRGLYKITRGQIDDTAYFNRLYIEGSDKNIPSGYRGSSRRLKIEGGYIELPLTVGQKRREASIVIDDIFPKRVGTFTAVSADWLSLTDSSLDFDINGHRIEGQKATVEVISGENQGRSFEIDTYNATTKTITIIVDTETTGDVRPSGTFSLAVGDKYFLAGIRMPESYIAAAEAELQARGRVLLNKANNTLPPYSVEVSDKFMRDNGVTVNAGDRVRLKDVSMNLDAKIRISAVKFLLVDPYKVQLLISDVIPLNNTEKAIVDIDKGKKETTIVNKVSAESARRNMLDIRRLQQSVFDPDGYFDPENIKPNSIETLMLSVGAKSQNFGLNGVSINANTDGDPNFVTVSQGALIHYEIQIEGLGYVWQMAAAEFLALDPNKTYFLSAKCRTTALTGEWVLSETPIKTEAETGYYHFYVGLFYPVTQGSRGYDLTNGMTFIVGDRITTGRIQSLDGLSFLDLSQNKFNVGDLLTGLDWDVTNAGQLTIRGNIVANNASFIGLIVQNLIAGKVRITAAANNIRMVDTARDKIIMLLDDDSALEGAIKSQLPPITDDQGVVRDPDFLYQRSEVVGGADTMFYYYAKRGVGATFGTPGEAVTSIGRAGIFSTDTNGIIHMQRKLDLTTGRGYIRDNVYNGLIYESLINKTSGLRMSAQFKIQTIGGINYVVADEVQTEVERMYNPNVIADAGDNGNSGGGGGVILEPEPTDPEPPVEPPVALTTNDYPYRVGYVKKEMGVSNSTYLSMFPTYGKNLIGSENKLKFGAIRTSTGGWRWAEADNFMAFAKTHNIPVHLHGPAWYNDWPNFMQALVGTPDGYEVGKALVYEHYATVFARYPDQFISIDGVNEQIKDDGTEIQTGPRALFGDDLWEIYYGAIQAARPNIVKLITDFNYETGNMNRTNTTVAIIDRLASKGITIEGIGFQMHTALGSNIDVMRERFRFWDNRNMKVMMTELDVKTNIGGRGTVYTQGMAVELADFYVDLLDAYEKGLRPANRFGVLMFAVSDKEGESHLNYPTKTHHPMLFDENYQRKLAFNKVVERLLRQPEVFEIYQDFELGDISSGNFIGSPTGGTSPQVWQMISSDPNAKAHVTSTGLSMAQTQINVFNHVVVNGSSANFTASTRAGLVFGYDVRVMHFAFRFVDGNNMFSVQAYKSGSTDVWRLVKRKTGTDIVLHTSGIKPSWGQVISVTCDLDTISYSINGIQVGSVADSDFQTATKLGFKFKGHFDADKESSFKYIKYNPKLEL